MPVRIDTDTEVALRRFVIGEMPASDLEAWIVSAMDELPEGEQPALWQIRLLLTEHGEGLRSIDEARERAGKLLLELSTPLRSDSVSRTTHTEAPGSSTTSSD